VALKMLPVDYDRRKRTRLPKISMTSCEPARSLTGRLRHSRSRRKVTDFRDGESGPEEPYVEDGAGNVWTDEDRVIVRPIPDIVQCILAGYAISRPRGLQPCRLHSLAWEHPFLADDAGRRTVGARLGTRVEADLQHPPAELL
jgi:hypothetical protein